MIFAKYLISTMLRNQFIVLLILFLVFFSQRFIRLLHFIVDNNIPKFLIFIFFCLGIPEIVKLIFPVSLFIGILITFNYFHLNNEVIAMYSCGVGNGFFLRMVLLVSSITTVISIVNVFFLSPFCLRYQNQLVLRYQSDFNVMKLFAHQFQFMKRINSVFFVNSVYKKKFEGIFFIQVVPNDHCSIIVADHGYIERVSDGHQWIVLSSGNYYFWNTDIGLYPNFYVNNFSQYRMLIDRNLPYSRGYLINSVTEMFVNQLWSNSSLDSRVELHWRLTLVIVAFVMAMVIVPLSLIQLNNNYLLNVLPAIILYLVFFLLQIFLRSYISKGYVGLIWIWVVNFFYIFIAVVLNFWNSVVCRKFRWRLKIF